MLYVHTCISFVEYNAVNVQRTDTVRMDDENFVSEKAKADIVQVVASGFILII